MVVAKNLSSSFGANQGVILAFAHYIGSKCAVESVVYFFYVLYETFSHIFFGLFTVIKLGRSTFDSSCAHSVCRSTFLALGVMRNCPFSACKCYQSVLTLGWHVKNMGITWSTILASRPDLVWWIMLVMTVSCRYTSMHSTSHIEHVCNATMVHIRMRFRCPILTINNGLLLAHWNSPVRSCQGFCSCFIHASIHGEFVLRLPIASDCSCQPRLHLDKWRFFWCVFTALFTVSCQAYVRTSLFYSILATTHWYVQMAWVLVCTWCSSQRSCVVGLWGRATSWICWTCQSDNAIFRCLSMILFVQSSVFECKCLCGSSLIHIVTTGPNWIHNFL